MRLRRASASNGIVDRRVRLSHETVRLAARALIGLWMVGSLIQQASVNQSLNRQAAELREENAALAVTNDQYRRDIAAVSSGAAAEEEARKDGYARSDEKLYLIGTPPPPTPRPSRPAQPQSARGPLETIWHLLFGPPGT